MSGTWVIIASGPSLTQAQVDYCRGKAKVLVINNSFQLAPWADILYFCDAKWIDWHHDEALNFEGQIWTQDEESAKKYRLNYIRSEDRCGLSTDPALIHQGSNSGYQAINFVLHRGARRIILLGYDMRLIGGRAHWHDDHPDGVKSIYDGWLIMFATLADSAKKLNLEIINATPNSALKSFPMMTLEQALTAMTDRAF